MAKIPVRAVLDTNVLVSGMLFSGKPRQIIELVSKREIHGITSPALSSELLEVLSKKFQFSPPDLQLVKNRLQNEYESVDPGMTINASKDPDDNRVLEAAVTGGCTYVVTGDPHLLEIGKFRNVVILSPALFLDRLRAAGYQLVK